MGNLERLKGIRDEVLEPMGYENGRPKDTLDLQLREDGQQKFVGALLWDVVDLLTFGALEKKKQPKANNTTASAPSKSEQPQQQNKSSDANVQISQSEYNNLVNEVGAMNFKCCLHKSATNLLKP